jgi:hypothetical protein
MFSILYEKYLLRLGDLKALYRLRVLSAPKALLSLNGTVRSAQ